MPVARNRPVRPIPVGRTGPLPPLPKRPPPCCATWSGRLGQSLILLFIVSLIGFFVLSLAPGGPLSQFALSPGMTQEQMDRVAEQMGLNRPIIVQYLDWLTSLLAG